MSRPQKQDTDDYIAALTGSSNKTRKSNLQDEEMQAESWTSSSYSRLRDNRDSSQGHNCSSRIVLAFSVLLFFIGIGVIVIAAIEKDHKLLPICPKCDQTLVGMYVAGGAIIVVAIIGAAAANLRKKIIAIPNIIFLFLLAIVLLGVSIAIIVFATGSGLGLSEAWKSDVTNSPDEICSIQRELKCSGFDLGCCYGPDYNHSTTAAPTTLTTTTTAAAPTDNTTTTGNTTNTTTPTTTTTTTMVPNDNNNYCYTIQNGVPPPWVSQVCVPTCVSNIYDHTCDGALRDKIKSNLGAILGGTIPLSILMIIVAVLSWKMTKTAGVYD